MSIYKIKNDAGVEIKGSTFKIISGSTVILSFSTGSFNISGSLNTTSSWATNATTASSISSLNQNVIITGSLTVVTGSNIELQVTNTGVTLGNVITDTHRITGSLNISGSLLVNGNEPGKISSNLYLYYNY